MQRSRVEGELSLDRTTLDRWTPDPNQEDARERKPSDGALRLSAASLGAGQICGPAKVAADLEAALITIDRDLVLDGVSVGGPNFDLSGARIGGSLTVHGVEPMSKTPIVVKLQGANVGELHDGPGSWPQRDVDSHYLDSISIARVREPNLEWRIPWLKANAIWTPQPWQMLSAALRRDGHDVEARNVAIERENERTRRAGLPPWSKPWRAVLHWTIGYGYRPIYALGWALFIVSICAALYTRADFHSKPGAPESAKFLYSIDAFIPVDLGYFSTWAPNAAWWSALAVLEAALGWLLAALLIGALTGLLKKD